MIKGYSAHDEKVTKDGTDTSLRYSVNTGIAIGVGIKHALDAIALRPIGAPLANIDEVTPSGGPTKGLEAIP